MRAMICSALGESPRLVDVAEPVPLAGDVVIDIAACGVNFADTLILQGKYQKRADPPFAPGFEVAGVIASVGADVTGFAPGDRVMALPDFGGYADLVCVPAHLVTHLPDSVDFIDAAAFQIAYGTSWIGLKYRAGVQSGEVVLVHGAAGGVGATAVECAKMLGASVIATAGGPEKCALARHYGADFTIDYASENIRDRVLEICAAQGWKRGVDVVYDPVGGDVFAQSLRCVAPGARLLVIGFASGDVPQIPANILLVKNISVLGFYFGAWLDQNPDQAQEAMGGLLAHLAAKDISPVISKIYDLADANAALDALRMRTATGKLVIDCRTGR
ncbi:NADPH:quinone oxidoreductase family protein [Thalassospira sp.]|uniref:NADPH:quinone oxidoreductase family protein n=1 Tax=Thalassospira sp. TaxID=1912094 RepID=UPI0027353CA9|nr:NADPH:quinone oxidoreductase family protein [Thalassospira sp.]MDP2699003.1 NADPH:quinone oxidoreductase family protein [Thalassospira sp.]